MPEIAGIVLVKLIADFVASLVTVTLPLATIVNSTRLILRQILPSSSGPTSVSPRATSGGTYGGTADSSRSQLSSPALQEIGRCAAASSRTRCAPARPAPAAPTAPVAGPGTSRKLFS